MKGLPPELIYILIFGAIVVFNLLVQRAARRRQPEAAPEEVLPEEIPEDIWGRAPVPATALPEPAADIAPARRAATPNASPAPSRRRFSKRSLFGDRRKVQDAFVAATILGRCSADEPHDVR